MKTLTKFISAGAALAIAGVAVVAPLGGDSASAVLSTQQVNVVVDSAITINGSTATSAAPPVTITYNAGETGFKVATQPVTVETNDPDGYVAYLTMNSGAANNAVLATTNNLEKGTDFLGPVTTPVATISATEVPAGADGAWGARATNATATVGTVNYRAVPLSDTDTTFNLATTTDPTTAPENIAADFGSFISGSTPQGTYTNYVLYTVVGNN